MKYFNNSEFKCKCCGWLPRNGMSEVLLEKLDLLREKIGVPIYVSSAYRCPEHNAAVGGVPNSQHVDGTAVDIYTDSLSVDELADAAMEFGFDAIGRYYDDEFVHLDCRNGGRTPNYYTW